MAKAEYGRAFVYRMEDAMMLLARDSAGPTNTYPAGGYAASGPSRAGIIGTIGVHALLVGGYFLLPADVVETFVPTILVGTNIPDTPPPPEQSVEQERAKAPLQKAVERQPFVPDTTVDLDTSGPIVTSTTFPMAIDPIDPGTNTDVIPDPRRPDVLTGLSIHPQYMRDFQPDYPPAMQRAQEEGKVTVRVFVGPDGRVTAVEKIFASSDAFWDATRLQALRKWRFRAATRNGTPIASEKVMTVHFQLN